MSPTKNERNIILLSEVGHVHALARFLKEHTALEREGFALIPLSIEVEYALTEKGMTFDSGGSRRTREPLTMTLSEEWASSILESKRWEFFTYRGVSLSRLHFLSLQWYLSYVIYYADIVANVVAAYAHATRIVFFYLLVREPSRGSTLVGLQIRSLVDVVECLARESGRETIVVAPSSLSVVPMRSLSFTLKRALFGIGIAALNALIRFARRPKRIRILASDYWRNLESCVSHLDSAEIFLIDRKEAFNAGLLNIWKYRMHFLHIDACASRSTSEREEAHTRISKEFESLQRNAELPACKLHGFSLEPLVSRALALIVKDVLTNTLKQIDDAHAMIERIKPHIVLLRATSSTQTHFVVLAQVARVHGVPSLEVQHGLQYQGPGSFTRRHSAQFMGVYGPFTQKEMRAAGDTFSIPIIIGSPRFDIFASMLQTRDKDTPPKKEVTFLCIANSVDLGTDADTYAYWEYFSAIADAVRNTPNVRIIIKLRQGSVNSDAFVRKMSANIFSDIPYTIVQNEPIAELYFDADVVISHYSTVIIEAIQCKKPVVFLALSPVEKFMGLHHFRTYVESNAIRMSTSKEDLARVLQELVAHPEVRTMLAEQGMAFLKREYSFDGHASERMGKLIRMLASGKDLK